MSSPTEIEQRVTLSLALQRYLRAIDRFEAATAEFNQACESLRSCLSQPRRFVSQVSYRFYLVTSDGEGNFDVEQVDSL